LLFCGENVISEEATILLRIDLAASPENGFDARRIANIGSIYDETTSWTVFVDTVMPI